MATKTAALAAMTASSAGRARDTAFLVAAAAMVLTAGVATVVAPEVAFLVAIVTPAVLVAARRPAATLGVTTGALLGLSPVSTFGASVLIGIVAVAMLVLVDAVLQGNRASISHLILPAALLVCLLGSLVYGGSNPSGAYLFRVVSGGVAVGMAASVSRVRLVHVQRAMWLAALAACAIALTGGERSAGRLIGIGHNANGLALVAALGLIALVADRGAARRPMLRLAGAVPFVATMLQTRSQGGFVVAGVGLATYVWNRLDLKRRVVLAVVLAAFAAVALSTGISTRDTILHGRTDEDLAVSYRSRSEYAVAAARYALTNPVTGIGLGNFEERAATDPRLGVATGAHNTYLGLAAEAGVVGIGLFLATIRSAWRRRRAVDDPDAWRALVAAFLTAFVFATLLESLTIASPFWLLLGLAWGRSARVGGRYDPAVPRVLPAARRS